MKQKKIIVYPIFITFIKEFSLEICNELTNRGYEVWIFSTINPIIKYFKKNKFKVVNPNEYFPIEDKQFDDLNLSSLTKREVYYFKCSPRYLRKKALKYINCYTSFIKSNSDAKIIIYQDTELLGNIICEYIAKKFKISHYTTNWTGKIPNSIFFDKTLFVDQWVDMSYAKNYNNQAKKYVLNFIENEKNKKRIIGTKMPSYFSLYFIKKGLKYFYICLTRGKGNNEYSNILNKAFLFSYSEIRYKFTRYLVDKYDKNKEFYYFPLHVPNDAALTQFNQGWFDQYEAIKYASERLPKGVYLYVKEHPLGRGLLSYKIIKKIRNLKNVKLVSSDINSHTLIKESIGVINIGGDVGWEALRYYKPVAVLGRAFYKKCPEVSTKLDSKFFNKKKLNKEIVNKFIYCVLKSHYLNTSYFKKTHLKLNYSRKNIKSLCDAFEDRLRRDKVIE